jgi:hypothetical protein
MSRCVECLSCGLQRLVAMDAGECPRCGYLGWAPSDAVTEDVRRQLRDVPVGARRPAHLLSSVIPFPRARLS